MRRELGQVGGHAVSFHGYPRFTHVVDVVVLPDERNASALLVALSDFGFKEVALQASDFLEATLSFSDARRTRSTS